MVQAKETRTAPPTLEEVAAVAGVSRATVSRVVNGSPRVSESARAAVERAVERTGYVPNRAARTLVTRKTYSVALVLTEPTTRVFSDPFFARALSGASGALSDNDFQLVLLMPRTPRERARVERYLAAGHVDGALLLSLHGDDPLPLDLRKAGLPVVLMGRPTAAHSFSYVDADNRGGGFQAAQHLVGRGRVRIGTITGPLDMPAGNDRLTGFKEALAVHGIAPDDALVEPADFSREGAVMATRRLLDRRPDVDGLFVASDLMATGAFQVLSERGMRVPDDVAVVGFDDSVMAQLTDPPLTTVRQPMELLGREMARLLLRAILEDEPTPRHLVLGTELVIRASS